MADTSDIRYLVVATEADGIHPTGMLSCFHFIKCLVLQFMLYFKMFCENTQTTSIMCVYIGLSQSRSFYITSSEKMSKLSHSNKDLITKVKAVSTVCNVRDNESNKQF